MNTLNKSRKKGTGIGILTFVVIILFVITAHSMIDLKEQGKKALLQKEKLQTRIDEQEERADEIKNYKAYVQTKKYIEDTAREKLGLVYKDEIIIKPEE
jgi:cell division protein DivIC